MPKRSRLDARFYEPLIDRLCELQAPLSLMAGAVVWESRFLSHRGQPRELMVAFPLKMRPETPFEPGAALAIEFEHEGRWYLFPTQYRGQDSVAAPAAAAAAEPPPGAAPPAPEAASARRDARESAPGLPTGRPPVPARLRTLLLAWPAECHALQRRAHFRVRIDPATPIAVTLVLERGAGPGGSLPPAEGEICDLSGGGLSVWAFDPPFPLGKGDALLVMFALPEERDPLGVLTQVEELRLGDRGLRLQLSFPDRVTGIHDQRSRRRLAEFVSACQRARRTVYTARRRGE